MNRIGLIAASALVFATAASAQQIQWVDPAVPKGTLEQRSEQPSGKPADSAIPQLVQDPTRGHKDADARQCLQFATNQQVHRCAEKYRSRASRAGVVKTAQSKETTKAADVAALTTKPADTPKPVASAKAESIPPKSKAPEAPKAAPAAKSTEPAKGAK